MRANVHERHLGVQEWFVDQHHDRPSAEPGLVQPPGYLGVLMTYDGARGVMTIFTHTTNPGNTGSLVWEFVNGSWLRLTTYPGMPPEYGPVAYDPVARGVIFFSCVGGISANNRYGGDTWIYSNRTWSNLKLAHHPAAPTEFSPVITYDSRDSELVLFQGAAYYNVFYPGWASTWVLG
jgi:hypothetical protein